MSYTLNASDLASITDIEVAFGTTRLLPKLEDIPEEFSKGNLYTELAEAIFYGHPLPCCEIEMKEGVDPCLLKRTVRAHLCSFEPKHEHKIAGVGYMISRVATLS